MKTAVFSSHKFEKPFLDEASNGSHELVYFDIRLTRDTAVFAKGCEAVSLFVSDDASAPVLDILFTSGVKYIVLRSAGFNNVDLKKAKELGIRVARVPAYSHYTDTDRRCKDLEEKGFRFIGMGVSGGEEGARKGPSMMPGGNKEAYEHLQPLFEAIAAKVNDEPCVTYLGPGGAGHFVKMVHNGIEYALMQLIAETYDLLKRGLHLDNNAIHDVFKQWNEGRLQSFLLEITTDIFAFKEDGSDVYLLDEIKDEAKAKGTGKWTSQVAMDLQVPVPVIDTAVSMRDLSKFKSLRKQIASMFDDASETPITQNKNEYLVNIEKAFYFSMVITYSQGMHLLYKASHEFKYDIELDMVAKIWRGGCIIRSSFLENIYQAFHNNANLEHILADAAIQAQIKESLPGIRTIVSNAALNGIGIPAYGSTLNYFDYLKSEKMPSNLIQAQRDYFGAHTYERIDTEGIFFTRSGLPVIEL